MARDPSLRTALALTVLLATVACATGQSSEASTRMNEPITASELASEDFTDLYDALRHLRPTWIRDLAGVFTFGQPVDQRPAQWLRSTPVDGVMLIELYECDDAMVALPVSRCITARYLDVSFRR